MLHLIAQTSNENSIYILSYPQVSKQSIILQISIIHLTGNTRKILFKHTQLLKVPNE